VSYRLVEEVLAGMPADASLSERLVLVVLAHHADEQTRECWPGMAKLAARAGMHAESVRKALNRLEGRGITLRSSAAARGHRTVYRIPPMPHSPNATQGLTPVDRPNAERGLSEESPNARPGKAQRSTVESPNATQGPEGQEPKEPSSEREEAPIMPDRAEPRDEALAVFSSSHPGREREALRAALAWYERRNGKACSHADAARYFSKWAIEDLQRKIVLAQPDERCRDCRGEGWLYDDPTDPSKARKCTHPRRAVA
jgi:hypothetical protein